MVKMLVSANISLIHTRNSDSGIVPLHEAAKVGNLEIVKFLLANNAASMPRTVEGYFPSDFARDNNHHAIADLLENYKPALDTFTHKWHHGTLGNFFFLQVVIFISI
jgi:ankyrin repeat protein